MAKRHILEHVFCVTARFFFEKFQTTLYKEEFFRKKKFYSRGYRAFRLCYGGGPFARAASQWSTNRLTFWNEASAAAKGLWLEGHADVFGDPLSSRKPS